MQTSGKKNHFQEVLHGNYDKIQFLPFENKSDFPLTEITCYTRSLTVKNS